MVLAPVPRRRPVAVDELSTSSPTPSAVLLSGTVMTVSNVALSVGWLFDGNQLCEPIGSPTTNAPSHVWGGLSG